MRPIPPPTPSVFVEQTRARGRRPRRLENMGRGGVTPVGGLALPRPAREPVAEGPLIDLLDTDIPATLQNEACLQPVVPEDTRERDRVFLEMSDTPSLEGAQRTCVGSVAVFQLQRGDSATVLPCPEDPEEKDNFIVGVSRGLPHPVSVLPALAGVLSPAFPGVRELSRSRSPQLIPALRQMLARMDHLNCHIEQHLMMLDYSRQDLNGLGQLMKELMDISGIGWEDLRPGRQSDGKL